MFDLPKMVDMRLTKEDTQDGYFPSSTSAPAYPYGLSIRLSEKELSKLGVTIEDFEVDDLVHLHCFGVVTCVSETQKQDGDHCCSVEIQVTHIACEDEEAENKQEEKRDISKRLYK